MILCYLYRYRYIICTTMFQAGNVYPNEQYNIENFGVLMCPSLSILANLLFLLLFGTFCTVPGTPLGRTPDQNLRTIFEGVSAPYDGTSGRAM